MEDLNTFEYVWILLITFEYFWILSNTFDYVRILLNTFEWLTFSRLLNSDILAELLLFFLISSWFDSDVSKLSETFLLLNLSLKFSFDLLEFGLKLSFLKPSKTLELASILSLFSSVLINSIGSCAFSFYFKMIRNVIYFFYVSIHWVCVFYLICCISCFNSFISPEYENSCS